MREAREERDRQLRAVAFGEHAYGAVKEVSRANRAANERRTENQQRGRDREVEGLAIAQAGETLGALLHVNAGQVEAEDVAGQAGDEIAPVSDVVLTRSWRRKRDQLSCLGQYERGEIKRETSKFASQNNRSQNREAGSSRRTLWDTQAGSPSSSIEYTHSVAGTTM